VKRAFVITAFVLSACTSAARTETQQLVTAVDRFRKAANAEKPSHVDAIRQSPCTDAQVCTARMICVESAEATAKGLSLTAQAASLMKTVTPGDDTTPIERMLDDAKKSNELGMKKLGECDDQLMALKRKHGV
jgi:hypothetical protein